VLDNFATGRRENLQSVAGEIDLVEGDIYSFERVNVAIRGCEIVLHQAALPSVPRSVEDPLTSNAANVTGTLNVLLAARDGGVRRVVFASSSSIYGANPALPKREDLAPAPMSPYAVAKLAAEGYCRSFSHVYGLETVSLRYFNVFGPKQDPLSQYAAVIPRFITAILNGERPVIFGDGEQSRDFTFVDNTVEANMRAIDAQTAVGGVYNVACGYSVSLNRLVEEIGALVGSDVAPTYTEPRVGDVRHSRADISAAVRDLEYEPFVSLAEGLERTVAYYRDKAMVPQPGHAG
jgi:UDP-N-acetylglucosamine/UDP-N-acetyl-alpha-D-glucosaminouronate 4-epimerase